MVDAAIANPFMAPGGRSLGGQLSLDVNGSGTLHSPRVAGRAQLVRGSLEDFVEGIHLSDLNASVTASETTVHIEKFTGRAGEGTFAVNGDMSLSESGFPINLTITAKRARLLSSDLITARMDADLTMQESRMPALGKKISAIGTGSTAYDGKRALAKRDIGQWLFRRGYALSGIRDLTQFNRAAVYLELSYIYRDLATRNDEISADKAAYYLTQFGTEIESISIIYSPPPDGGEQAGKRSVATWWRS